MFIGRATLCTITNQKPPLISLQYALEIQSCHYFSRLTRFSELFPKICWNFYGITYRFKYWRAKFHIQNLEKNAPTTARTQLTTSHNFIYGERAPRGWGRSPQPPDGLPRTWIYFNVGGGNCNNPSLFFSDDLYGQPQHTPDWMNTTKSKSKGKKQRNFSSTELRKARSVNNAITYGSSEARNVHPI